MSEEASKIQKSSAHLERLNVFLEWKYLSLAMYLFAFSQAVQSFFINDTNWFSSSGAVIAVVGLLLTIKKSVLKTKIEINSGEYQSGGYCVMAEEPELTPQFREMEIEKAEIESKLEMSGVMLSVIGTLVWAYGFLLPTLSCIKNMS